MQNWSIRRAELRDAPAVSACIEAAYQRYTARITDLPPVSEGCEEDIAKHQVWVATVDREIVGALVLVPQNEFMKLANLAVHPDHEGNGLGRALIELSESEALKQGYRELRLNTHSEMPENVQLYKHLGWEQVGLNGNTVSMRKSL